MDDATFDRLVDAVVALDPPPRERRWVSLSLCIVDAVWSIGANYDNVVVPFVRQSRRRTRRRPADRNPLRNRSATIHCR